MNIQNFNSFTGTIPKTKTGIKRELKKLFPDHKCFTSLFSVEDGNPKTAKGKKLKVHTKILHLAPSTESKNYYLDFIKSFEEIKSHLIGMTLETYLTNIDSFNKLTEEIENLTITINKLKLHSHLSFNFCAMASEACIKACLFNAGNPVYEGDFFTKSMARNKRSIAFIVERELFLELLKMEIDSSFTAFENNPKFKEYDVLGFRLNGTQDILFESLRFKNGQTVIEYILSKGGICYDYTKYINRHTKKSFPKNYHLTFSWSGDNESNCIKAFNQGLNVAIPFIGKLPEYFKLAGKWVKVFNGDESDVRFYDPENCVVGLKFKWDTKNNIPRDIQEKNAIESGFVIDSKNDARCFGFLAI